MEAIVHQKNNFQPARDAFTFLPWEMQVLFGVEEDVILYNQQLELSEILENSSGYSETIGLLQNSSLGSATIF